MAQDQDADNPLDDELLKELGLEPRPPAPKSGEPSPASAPVLATGRPSLKAPSPFQNPPPEKTASPKVPEKSAQPSPETTFSEGVKKISENLPIQVVAVLGKKNMTIKDLVALKPGEVLELKKLPQDTVDLVANGKLIARGELVLIDGKLGIQIKQLAG